MIDQLFQIVMLSILTVVLLFLAIGGLFLLAFQSWDLGNRIKTSSSNRELDQINIERKQLDLELYEETARIRIEKFRRDLLGTDKPAGGAL